MWSSRKSRIIVEATCGGKFLISRDGKILKRFETPVKPESKEVEAAIEAALAAK